MDAQTRQRPAGTGREVANETGLRQGYHGITTPNIARLPREPAYVARDLRAASEALIDLADDFELEVRPIQLATADALANGINRLLAELRQGQRP